LLNAGQVVLSDADARGGAPPGLLDGGVPKVLIDVATPGLMAVTYAALSSTGFPLGDPALLGLSRDGVTVPMEWEGDGDAVFEPGERLVFVAAPRFSRWTRTDTYILAAASTPAPRMSQRPSAPAGQPAGIAWADLVVEENRIYTPDCLCAPLPAGRDGDRWTWQALTRPGAAGFTHALSLAALDVTRPATLTVWAIGFTSLAASPDHRLRVGLNGATLGQMDWDGKTAITATLPVMPGQLGVGANSFSFDLSSLPGVSVDGAWLDALSVRYALSGASAGNSVHFSGQAGLWDYSVTLAAPGDVRAYDVTNPEYPVRLTGLVVTGAQVRLGGSGDPHRYLAVNAAGIQAPVSLRLAEPLPEVAGADYVIVTPSAFAPSLADLVSLRRQQGLSVAVVPLEAIYAAAGGRPTPEAIWDFLQRAYATWHPRPTYVLLVGDGTFDPKRYRDNSLPTQLPPYLAEVDPWAGETASDNRYVTVDGADNLPDMLVGRLPANNLAELQAMVAKVVANESSAYSTGWNAAAVFVADDADPAGDHPTQSRALAEAWIAGPFFALPIVYAPPATPITATRQAVLSAWNAGAGLVVYTGHASTHQWAAEALFHDSAVAGLANWGRLPLLLELTCLSGSFHVPGLETLDEALVRHPGGGALAALAPTGLGVSTGHDALANGFLEAIYVDGQNLGQAALAGKLNVAASRPFAIDLVDTFGLLGDPATRPHLSLAPWPGLLFMPVIHR
jgi:hypothetical protein